MNRKIWKWTLGISIGLLILLAGFILWAWAAFNVVGALFFTLMGEQVSGSIPLREFLSNFIGSPLFWICTADLAVLILSAVMLTVTKKQS